MIDHPHPLVLTLFLSPLSPFLPPFLSLLSASLTAYFKPVVSPSKKAKAAASTSSAASTTAATAPARKRKANSQESKNGTTDATAADLVNQELAAQADEATQIVAAAAKADSSVPSSSSASTSAAAASSTAAASSSSSKRARTDTPSHTDSLSSLLPGDWAQLLKAELDKPYWSKLESFLKQQQEAKVNVFPQRGHIFRALDLCPLDKIKLVIIGNNNT